MGKAVRDYLGLAGELAEAPRRRVVAAAKALAAQGEVTAGQMSSLTEEIRETSRSNREALANLVRFEVDRALGRLGLASSDEVSALALRVATLEAELRAATAALGPVAVRPEKASARAAAVVPAPAKKAPAKKAPAKKAMAKKAVAKSSMDGPARTVGDHT
jgi:polyhydroxyalkanoate synthesis regulator phasin